MTETQRLEIDGKASLANNINIIGDGHLVVGPYVEIEPNVLIDLGQAGSIEIGARSKIKFGSVLRSYDGFLKIGKRSTVGEYSILAGHGGLSIGDAVIIAGHCYISAADHIFSGSDPIRFQGETAKGITISDGVWLGARSVVLDGVVVGENTVIAAGGVVTKNLKRDTVCMGTPCKEVKPRIIQKGSE